LREAGRKQGDIRDFHGDFGGIIVPRPVIKQIPTFASQGKLRTVQKGDNFFFLRVEGEKEVEWVLLVLENKKPAAFCVISNQKGPGLGVKREGKRMKLVWPVQRQMGLPECRSGGREERNRGNWKRGYKLEQSRIIPWWLTSSKENLYQKGASPAGGWPSRATGLRISLDGWRTSAPSRLQSHYFSQGRGATDVNELSPQRRVNTEVHMGQRNHILTQRTINLASGYIPDGSFLHTGKGTRGTWVPKRKDGCLTANVQKMKVTGKVGHNTEEGGGCKVWEKKLRQ